MKYASFLLVAALMVGAGACRSEDDPGTDPTPDGGDEVGPKGTSIYDVQQGRVAVGDVVTLEGVVVTAVDSFAGGGAGRNVFVQDPMGGAYSGILLRDSTVEGGTVDDLAPGDVVTVVTGMVDEFALMTDTSGQKTTQVRAGIIRKTGTAEVPAAQVLSPWELVADPEEAEKWEGVLIRFENVAITSNARQIGDDMQFLEFFVTGPLRIDSGLTDLSALKRDECYASLTGVLDYFFSYKLLPRGAQDLQLGGNCLSEGGLETPDPALCENGTDDDHDGFTDCQDIPCQKAVGASCFDVSTVAAVQQGSAEGPAAGAVEEGSMVRFEDLVVTAVVNTMNQKLIWAQDRSGGMHSGILFFRPNGGGDLATFAVGDSVDAWGTVKEHKATTDTGTSTVTEIVTGTVTEREQAASPPTPALVSDPATLATAATAEAWEGVLVELTNVSVSTAVGQFGVWKIRKGTGLELDVDDVIFKVTPPPAVGGCYASIKGIVHYEFGAFRFLPRSAADLTLGGTCQ